MKLPSLTDIEDAHTRIKPFIHQTPVMSSQQLNRLFDCELYLKCENFQRIGAFKFRGAYNAISKLDDNQKSKGGCNDVQ